MIYDREYKEYCKENREFEYSDIYSWLCDRFQNNTITKDELDQVFLDNSCSIKYIRMFNMLFTGYYVYEYRNVYSVMILMLKIIEKKNDEDFGEIVETLNNGEVQEFYEDSDREGEQSKQGSA